MPKFMTISPTHVPGMKEYAWKKFLAGSYIAIGWINQDLTGKTLEEIISIISEKKDVLFLENFRLVIPNELGLKVIVELSKHGTMKSIDIIQFLFEINVEGFENYFGVQKRSQKTSLLMRLNRTIMEKLENSGYIIKNKIGRENEYKLTRSGEYIANLCGLINIDLDEIHKEN